MDNETIEALAAIEQMIENLQLKMEGQLSQLRADLAAYWASEEPRDASVKKNLRSMNGDWATSR